MRYLPALLAFALAACVGDGADTAQAWGGGGVYATNYPLRYFAQRIAGEHLEIQFLVPDDRDPAFWRPTDEEILRLQSADLILLNGASYAKWLDTVTLPEWAFAVTSAAFADAYLELPITKTHSHGSEGAHSHAGTDYNTWLDPIFAMQQAAAVLAALCKLAPEHRTDFERNAAGLQADLEALDAAFREFATDVEDEPIFSSHPVYGYLAARYGWDVRSLLWEPDAMPSQQEWESFGFALEQHRANWMLYEEMPPAAVVERLEQEFGVDVAVFRPCGNRPASGDYIREMQAGIERLREVF